MTCQICLSALASKKYESKNSSVLCQLASISPIYLQMGPLHFPKRGHSGFGDYSFSTMLSTHQKEAFETLTTASSSPLSLGFLNLNLKSLWSVKLLFPVSSEGGEHSLSHAPELNEIRWFVDLHPVTDSL